MEVVPDPNVRIDRNPLLYAISAAAYKGHDEVLPVLLNIIVSPHEKYEARLLAIQCASRGNQLSTLELGLGSGTESIKLDFISTHALQKASCSTGSLPIFERLLPMIVQAMGTERKALDYILQRCWDEICSRGAKEIMEYFLNHTERPHSFHLWMQGLDIQKLIKKDLFNEAVMHWNPNVVQLLLEQPATANYRLKDALLTATRRENEKIARLLLGRGSTRLHRADRDHALLEARHQGLESMAKLILEFDAEN